MCKTYKNFVESIDRVFSERSDKSFCQYFTQQKISFSFRQLERKAMDFVKEMRECGVKSRQRIALAAEISPDSIACMIACVYANVVMVIIDPKLPLDEINDMLQEANVQGMVVPRALLVAVTLNSTLPLFDCMELKCVNKDMVSTEQPEVVDGGNVMAILFSSGTTDKRKGIIIGYGEQLKAAKCQQVIFDKKTRYLSCFPICHISGFSTFWGVFLAGGRIGILEQVDAVSLNKAFQTFKPTLFGMIPGVYENYQKKCEEYFDSLGVVKKTIISGSLKICGLIRTYLHIKLGIVLFRKVRDRVFGGNLKYLGVGGGILSQDVYTFFYNMGFLWVNIYALTELNVPVCFTAPERNAPQVSVGKVNENKAVKIKIIHSGGDDGEVAVRSEYAFLGYLNEQRSKGTCAGKWFRTGDLGYIDKKGYLHITGRKKESIHLKNGEKVSPEDIENALGKVLLGYDFACCGIRVPNKFYDEIHLFIKGSDSREEQMKVRRLIMQCHKYSAIKEIHFIDHIPRTAVGKVMRYRLVEVVEAGYGKQDKPDECKTLQDYLRQKTGLPYEQIEKCTMEELGIDSLESMEICVWLEEKYGICLDDILKPSVSVEEVLKCLENARMNEPVRRKRSMVFYQFVRRMAVPVVMLLYRPVYLHRERIVHTKTIFAPNHRRTADSFVLAAGIPVSVHWAALKRFFDGEDSIFNNSKAFPLRYITRFAFRRMGMVPIDRKGDNVQSLHQLKKYVGKGECIGIYPEGTTNKRADETELGRIEAGAFRLAEMTGAAVQPIAVVWDMNKTNKVIVNFCPAIQPTECQNENDLQRTWESRVLKGIDEIKKEYGCR